MNMLNINIDITVHKNIKIGCLLCWVLPTGFLLLRYLVLFTVALSHFVYLDLYVLREDVLIS